MCKEPLPSPGPPNTLVTWPPRSFANLLQGGNVTVTILPGNREQIYSALDSGNADLAITASLPDSKVYDYQVLDSERLMLVAHRLLADALAQAPIDASVLNTLPSGELRCSATAYSRIF